MHSVQVTQSVDFCPAFSDGKKITELQQAHLWAMLNEEPACPSRRVLEKMAQRYEPVPICIRHVNRLRAKWGLSRGKGRPRGTPSARMAESGGALMKLRPQVLGVGVHLFAAWMEGQELFVQVVTLLQQQIQAYGEAHPGVDFPLLHHTEETLLRRFQALFYGPLFGIEKLTEFDVKEHGLDTLIGRRYQSSTLNQFLGQLERLDGGEALLPALVPADPEETGDTGGLCYVDGHMIAFWTKASMHKGKITMLGRIMAGSQAVIAHNQSGQAVFVEYYAPDIRMPRMIVRYCQKVVTATGIEVFVIDREANSVELARSFEKSGLGLLSMLDNNEYDGLNSWKVTRLGTLADGSLVSEGAWNTPKGDDPRHFVLVETSERVLVYWGTSKVKETLDPLQWPAVYRQRSETQENSFKRMKAHGALDVNYGAKKIVGPDRHQQRAVEKLDEAKEKAQQKVTKKEELLKLQEAKVIESQEKGHGTRLEQRQRRLGVIREEWTKVREKVKHILEQLAALGTPKERADRDFRKQTIMTIRTLLLENALVSFLAAICATLDEKISLECLLKLLFDRSGACLETPSEMIYWVNTAGLSVAYRETLEKIGEGIGAMNLTCRGKPIRIRLREAPT
jgi:hypothetical protein